MYSKDILLWHAFLDTLYMVIASGTLAFIVGIPIGILLFVFRANSLMQSKQLYFVLNIFINIGRSIPFIILMLCIIPLTRFITGTSIGTTAAIVPLTISAIPFVARITENALLEQSHGLIETGRAMGATNMQIICRFLMPEAMPNLIQGMTLTLVTLVGYSAMAGAVGGGGLGDLGIRYGYQRFDGAMMLYTVIILVMMVQTLQWLGDKIYKITSH